MSFSLIDFSNPISKTLISTIIPFTLSLLTGVYWAFTNPIKHLCERVVELPLLPFSITTELSNWEKEKKEGPLAPLKEINYSIMELPSITP